MLTKKIKQSLLIILLVIALTGCATGATLRTARVLEKGEIEVSAGIAGAPWSASQVVVGAYGLSDNIEIEGRYEDKFVSLTPRFQLLRSEMAYIDCLTFFEMGYSGKSGFQWGPGVMLGKRWKYFEPYVSYRFRHFSSLNNRQRDSRNLRKEYFDSNDIHYVKFGNRFLLPMFLVQLRETYSTMVFRSRSWSNNIWKWSPL